MSENGTGARRSGRAPALVVSTHEYLRAHGKTPRGQGRWAFCPSSKFDRDDYLDYVVWAPYSTYANAKRWLRAQGKSGSWVACT